MNRSVFVVAAFLASCLPAGARESRRLLPPELEVELALSAAPERLRGGAAVLRLTETGYAEARRGDNGFTCLVSRPHPRAVAPMCYDAEGTRTIVARIVDEAAMRARGESEEAIESATAAGFASGKYRAPMHPGIAYMLSPMQHVVDPARGVRPYVPHLMFYAPNLTDADIGGERGGSVFVNRTGPHGMIIVPVGEKEREALEQEMKHLIERTERFLEGEGG